MDFYSVSYDCIIYPDFGWEMKMWMSFPFLRFDFPVGEVIFVYCVV